MRATDLSRRLGRRELNASTFTDAQCDALFAAILIDDEFDKNARLPSTIRFDYSQDELSACFRICRQLWYSGFDRDVLIGLASKLIQDRDLDENDRLRFKYMRAKFKHFRYAHALYGSAHRYPRLLDHMTIVMGHLQDAYRNRRRGEVLREAIVLRLFLTRISIRRLRWEADRIVLATPSDFRRYLEKDAATLAAIVANGPVTGHQFHAARKVVGRLVSFWDTLRTIEPSAERYDLSRSLSAINGLMGDLHDELVKRRVLDPASYGRSFPLPIEIRQRIEALLGLYPNIHSDGQPE